MPKTQPYRINRRTERRAPRRAASHAPSRSMWRCRGSPCSFSNGSGASRPCRLSPQRRYFLRHRFSSPGRGIAVSNTSALACWLPFSAASRLRCWRMTSASQLLKGAPAFALFGLACLLSLRRERPLMFFVGRQFTAGDDEARAHAWTARLQNPGFRRSMRFLTIVWGVASLAEATFGIPAAFLLYRPALRWSPNPCSALAP